MKVTWMQPHEYRRSQQHSLKEQSIAVEVSGVAEHFTLFCTGQTT